LTLDALPRRRRLHELQEMRKTILPFDGYCRSAALSIAATMIFAESDGTYSALFSRRSESASTHPEFGHVVPSCIFAPLQPIQRNGRDEFSIEQCILRGYAAELFGYDKRRWPDHGSDYDLSRISPIQELLRAVDQGHVSIRYCGLSVPLLSLRPEIYVLIFVHDISWFDAEIGRAQRDGKRLRLRKLELDEDFRPLDRRHVLRPTNMVPHAAAALSLSTHVAREMIVG